MQLLSTSGSFASSLFDRLSSSFLPSLPRSLFRRLILATPSCVRPPLLCSPFRPRSPGFRLRRLSPLSSSPRGKYRGTLSGRVFPAYYLSDPTSISGPRAFPCREIMHSPSERRREGRRLPRDRARRGFQGNFRLSSTRGKFFCNFQRARARVRSLARLNVTTASEKWRVDVDTSLPPLLFFFSLSSCSSLRRTSSHRRERERERM